MAVCVFLRRGFNSPYCLMISAVGFMETFSVLGICENTCRLEGFQFFNRFPRFLSVVPVGRQAQAAFGCACPVWGHSSEPSGGLTLLELTIVLFLLAKVVDLDPCLSKKPLEEKPSHPYSARESLSEVQSLSSFQSESCDDNGEWRVWNAAQACLPRCGHGVARGVSWVCPGRCGGCDCSRPTRDHQCTARCTTCMSVCSGERISDVLMG